MRVLRRYLRLFSMQLRASMLLSLQYRYDFITEGLINFLWTFIALIPLYVVYRDRPMVAGWSYPEALLVVGWFTLLEGVMDGAINPSLTSVVEHIRKGTLDFILLKPADAQFMVSTARFMPWKATNVLTAVVIFVYAFGQMGRTPSALGLAAAVLLLFTSILMFYSLWILTVCAAFYVVKVDNLTSLFNAIFDAARWPISVFPGMVRLFFTFIIPLAVMTTFPAQAMLGTLRPDALVTSVVGAVVFAALSRWVWRRSIGRYTSASS